MGRVFAAVVAVSAMLLSGCGENGVVSRFMLKPDHIIIERRAGEQKQWAKIKTVPGNATSYEDAELPALKTAAYRIRAANASGNSGYSDVATAALK